VTDETAFQMTLNRERITDLLQQAGQTQVAVPDFADGSIIAVHIPRGVISDYGDCPAQSSDSRKSLLPGCVVLVQTPSPTVSVPPNLNLQALAEAGLQVAGLSAAEAQAFCQNVDWTSTLVIPIPRNSSSYRTVSVDGVNGTLIEVLPRHENPGWYSLVWVKNGVVYSLNGGGSSAAATSIAESLD